MRKKLVILFLICTFFIGIFVGYNSKSYEGYELGRREEEILVEGIEIDNNKYEFNTAVKVGFGEEENSILQLSLVTEMHFDSVNNKYILENAELNIKPIIGEISSINPKNIEGNIFSQNFEIEVERNQSFNQVIEAGYAKKLLDNKNIVVNEVKSYNNLDINSKRHLRGLKNNSELISVNYNTLENYYNSWYRVNFEVTLDGQGIFTIY